MSASSRPVRHRNAWRIRWLDHTGKRCSATFLSYEEAERALRRQQVEVEQVKRGMRRPAPPSKTFGDLARYWREHRLPGKRSGAEDRRILDATLVPAFGKVRLADITTERVDAFIASRCAGRAPRTVRNYLALLRVMLRGAVRLGWLHLMPEFHMPRVPAESDTRQPWLTRPDVERLLRAARDVSVTAHALYATAAYTGMRAGELAGLRWDDVDLVRRTILVQRSFDGPTKTLSSRRVVPIVDALLPVLKKWKRECPANPLGLVFPSDAGTMHDKTSRIFRETLYRALDRAGFERPAKVEGRRGYTHAIHFHSFRHSFACNWRIAGGSLDDLIGVLGHTSRAMTAHYAALGDYVRPEHFRIFGEAAAE